MSFQLRSYTPPDFSAPALRAAPDVTLLPAPADGVAPERFHAMSIFPEYFKLGGAWHLAEESRMDCVAVWEAGRIVVREFRLLKQGDLVAVGRTEQGEEGILVYPDGFRESRPAGEVFAFRQGRSRETAFSRDYDELYALLRHERQHGKIVWVMGPAFAFDHDARNAFSRLIEGATSTRFWRGTPWPPTTWRRPTSKPPWARTSTPRRASRAATTTTWTPSTGSASTAPFPLSCGRSGSRTASWPPVSGAGSPMCWRAPSGTTARCPRSTAMCTRPRTPCGIRSAPPPQ